MRQLLEATQELEPPFALVDVEAFDANRADMLRRAGNTRLRLASKSVRCRALAERAGFQGTLAFTLPEALWLAELGQDDIVVGYPTVDRTAIAQLPSEQITVMVDAREHLDLLPEGTRVCIDIDAGLHLFGGRVRIGARRSPIRTPEQAAALARQIVDRGLRLDGVMAYEAQIAGIGDRPPGKPLFGLALRAVQARSANELAARRKAIVDAVQDVAPLRFVNGGGTGSIERTAAEAAVTEVAAGSGLFAPTLFDAYRAFTPQPAAFFCLAVVRRHDPQSVTVLGGGYHASGAAGRDRLPRPVFPAPLRLDKTEGAGEVQTPLLGDATRTLRIGDRVLFRHAKAGEMCERFDTLVLVEKGRIVATVPTYRGEGKCFL